MEGGEYKVERGNSLWEVAVRAYGDGYAWTRIWQANKSKLNSPELLEIGMVLTIPRE
ncbi:LysM peptidoglycan-binding domain-containing protein [Patescibacteria group bacterium]|nr:LysM peptidoglycan-binding domain-containing protein [Patescibacteria group bacterium]